MVVPHGFCVNLSVYAYKKYSHCKQQLLQVLFHKCYFINVIAIFKVPSSNLTEVNAKSHRNRAILLSPSIMLVHGILEVKSPRRSGLSLSDVKPYMAITLRDVFISYVGACGIICF